MRLFVGTAIAAADTSAIELAVASQLANAHWKPLERTYWHVTALFIGERSENLVEPIAGTVARIASFTPQIVLEHGRLVTMPKQDPTMLWVRFQPHIALTALHLALAEATGTEPSIYRPYWPHITLARARAGKLETLDGPVIIPSLRLDHLSLFRSTPSPQGAVHEPLATWAFSGTDPIDPVVAA